METRNQMANLKDTAKEYVAPETKVISELIKVSVNLELFNKVIHEGEADEFNYDYIMVDDVEYRVPKVVIKQLKAQLEANPSLKFFSVAKVGEGMKTVYTVIPLTE